jgi:hypothetical protein
LTAGFRHLKREILESGLLSFLFLYFYLGASSQGGKILADSAAEVNDAGLIFIRPSPIFLQEEQHSADLHIPLIDRERLISHTRVG